MAKIFSTSLALDSMKQSGYKDAAHAVSEIIDNSIQAGDGVTNKTIVEVICIEDESFLNSRKSSRIEQVAIFDNACGMDKETLRKSLAFGQGSRKGAISGIGKFGMGLPNASISQADRVDVWTWQNGSILHTYLDLSEISDQNYDEVPEPTTVENLPPIWADKSIVSDSPHGTLVVWSKLERLKWKRHKAFFSNTAFIVGRIYRYFIDEGNVTIRLAAFCNGEKVYDENVKPNDPLYLMPNTSSPEPFNESPAFESFATKEVLVKYKGENHIVKIKVSIASEKYRLSFYKDGVTSRAGDTPFGKHAAKNQGISVVRANRELEINNTFDIAYDTTERWWGVEVLFTPALDEVFGVTNNKQAATAFRRTTREEIAENEGINNEDVKQFLESVDDIRLPILIVSQEIISKLKAVRSQIKNQVKGAKKLADSKKGPDKAEQAANDAAKKDGKKGKSDELDETLSEEEKKSQLEGEIERSGTELDEDDKKELIASWLDKEKFIFESYDMRGSPWIFDVTQPAGKLKVTINKGHPAYSSFIGKIEEENGTSFEALKLLFAAWALMTDLYDSSEPDKARLLDAVKTDWGNNAKTMLENYES